MPFKSLFRGHKRDKQTSKRGVHFLGEHHSEASEEPPDGDHSILDQFQHMKLNKHEDKGRNHKRHHHHHHNRDSENSKHNGGSSQRPLLNRASSDPLPVRSDELSRNGRVARKSSSVAASLDSLDQLHDKRMRDIVQLEKYIDCMQHSAEDEEACHMASRLCCAEVLKTLYLRHEQQYVNFLQHTKSPESLISTSPHITHTKSSHLPDTCVKPTRVEDLGPTGDSEELNCQGGRKLHSVLKKTPSSFCRQTENRVPVASRRQGHRVSISLTPQVLGLSPIKKKSGFSQFEDENFGDSQSSLNNFFGESSLSKSAGLTEQSRGCGSNLSLTSYSNMAVVPANYGIY